MCIFLLFSCCLFQLISSFSLHETGITKNCYDTYRIKKDESVSYSGSGGNGVRAVLKEFPHFTAIGWSNSDRTLFGCGGSLISKKFVITAAHCSYRFQRGKKVPPNTARMGVIELDLDSLSEYDRSDIDAETKEEYAQQFDIIKVLPHPEYTSKKRYHDIALMELNREVTITDFVIPICLWDKEKIVFTDLEAPGFGEVEFAAGTSPNLNKVVLTTTTIDECRESYDSKGDKKLPDGLIEEQHLCASDKTGHEMDTCQGDSGGPLEYKMLSKTKNDWIKVPVLVGLTSFGQAGCGSSAPGVYTRIFSYIDWIETETKESMKLDECAVNFEANREKLPTDFPDQDLPSNVQIVGSESNCSGTIIHERFILTAENCINETKKNFIKTTNDQTIEIHKINEKNGLVLVELKEEIKFITKTADDISGYFFKVGPTCMRKEKLGDEKEDDRTVEASYQNLKFKFFQHLYNISDCIAHFDLKDNLSEEYHECLSGNWFVPHQCHIQPSSSSVYDDYIVDGELFHSPVPLLKSIVKKHDNCGAILLRKVTNDDIDWISEIIFKKIETQV